MNIMIAVPMNRPVEFRVFESFVRLANYRGQHNYFFALTQNSLVYDARETLVKQMLDNPEVDAIMFIDSDMTFDPRSVEWLAAHNQPFVTAKAFKRVSPYQPCFYNKIEPLDNGECYLESPVEYGEGLLKIEGCGMACCLIRREVFEQIKAPYFFPMRGMGEDLSFCLKVKEAGIPMYVDTTLQFGHLAQVEILERDFRTVYEAHKKNQTEKMLYVDGDK